MKRIAMIPARLGSKRVPRKNMRFLGGKPLVQWSVEAVRDSQLFDDVYLNSEAPELETLANRLGIKFYQRSAELAKDNVTSEHFVADFLKHVSCNVLFQVTPTSPFITINDLRRAADLIDDGANTVLSVKSIQAESFVDGQPVNFNPLKSMLPSQKLSPIDVMCNGIFAWRNFESTYGWQGRVELLTLSGDASLDIDSEEDFAMAEAILLRRQQSVVARYWSPTEHAESDPGEVLVHDGVSDIDMRVDTVNIERLLGELPITGGARRVIQKASNCATVISQLPGEGNRRHYHPDWDEWWLILEGEYAYEIEGKMVAAKKGDLISIDRGKWHRIEVVGRGRATRLAVSRDMVEHVYSD